MGRFWRVLEVLAAIAASITAIVDAILGVKKRHTSSAINIARTPYEVEKAEALDDFVAYFGRRPSRAELEQFMLEGF